MLLLALQAHETIVLETQDGPIELRLHLLDGLQARIGVDAPSSVRVVRQHDRGAAPASAGQIDLFDGDAEPWWQHPDEAADG